MALFDLRTALLALGRGNSPLDSIGTAFGVPQCLLDLGKDALNLIPTPILNTITKNLNEGKESALADIAKLKRKILLENGIFELDTENGRFRFVSDSSKNKLDENLLNKTTTIGDFISAIGAAAAIGGELYTNYTDAVSVLGGVKDCIETYGKFLELQKGSSSRLSDPADLLARYAEEIAIARDAEAFIEKADLVLTDIASIRLDRLRNPSLEPKFNNDLLDSSSTFYTSSTETQVDKPIFRLVFGPPKSKVGQFLLSVDGLYYDSQTGGLPSVSGLINISDKYKFNYPANLGGKGDSLSTKDLNKFVDTIFDLNVIDNSVLMTQHYNNDHFLQVLYGQKNRHVFNLSAQIGQLETSGYSEDSAMMINFRQQLYSVAAQHDVKINKRKKQIEIAVKAPTVFGGSKLFNYGEVPINDFSFLSNLNLAVAYETQKKLVFKQGEVSGVVLPLQPKFVKATEAETQVSLGHLVIPPVGAGSIVFETSGSTQNNVLSLTDSVVTDNLIAIYNFLESDVTYPGSNEFNLLNCAAKTNKEKAAQLVASFPSAVYTSGLGIPNLQGIVRLNNSTGLPSGLGSYIQLPQVREYQDLFYNPNGCTIDLWAYVPRIATSSTNIDVTDRWGTSCFHRVLFGCENTGGANESLSVGNVQVNYGSEIVRGLVCGFTRDIQITTDSLPNDSNNSNPVSTSLASSVHFYLAPTRSFNSSDIGFIRDTVTVDCGTNTYRTLKCSIPITTQINGKCFADVSGTFCHIVIVNEPKANSIKFYLDSQLMVTSGLDTVFGISPYTTPKIPSFIKDNSFSYSQSGTGLSIFEDGPTVSSFTPWILGGGYSDGMAALGGFMGQNSGLISGLKGHIGSVKFYSKALNSDEVRYNYEHQSPFFKNILL